MTTAKTKRQLRAEAVERLKMIRANIGMSYNELLDALIPGYPRNSQTIQQALIDLLTDDELANGTGGETNGIRADAPLADDEPPEGDAVAILRKVAADETAVSSDDLLRYAVGSDMVPQALETLADMVERDYVRRESVEGNSEWVANLRCSEWMEKAHKLERELEQYERVDEAKEMWAKAYEREMAKNAELAAERDEWKAKAECSSKVRASSSNDGGQSKHQSKEGASLSDPSGVLSNESEADAREKLEADIRSWHNNTRFAEKPSINTLFGWLDRQAAITERECREYEDALREQHHKRVANLRAELEAVRRERDDCADAADEAEAEVRRLRGTARGPGRPHREAGEGGRMSVKRALTAATWFRRCLKACRELRTRTGGRCERAADGCGGVGYCGYCMAKARGGEKR